MIKKVIIILVSIISVVGAQIQHPTLILTKNDAKLIGQSLGKYLLFDHSYKDAVDQVAEAIGSFPDVPFPKDPGGGYTHERHKKNYDLMQMAGFLYSITKEEKYAQFVRSMLVKYAELYPQLGKHPQGKKQTPGRLFWQSLNESVWLLHTIQAYDCIYDFLSEEDINLFEQSIFIPMTEFFLNECEHDFNLIHNHGTWMVAAVGMTGIVLGDDELVQQSLYGKSKDGQSGFIKQLDLLFSPDGYYTEGAYYARYALWPFFVFAESLNNNLPELKVYEYREEILRKAFYAATQMTYTNGEFLPINDALKEKTWKTAEMIYAQNFVYKNYGREKPLLSITKEQERVSLTGAGLIVAEDFTKFERIPEFNWQSVEFSDGPNGDEGGISIFRNGLPEDQELLLFKYTSHGLSHGHFDKLSFLFYDQGEEIIQDYGAARFLNTEQKDGGRYLPENNSFAKQTIAHNTLVVDETTSFKGSKDASQKYHSDRLFCNYENKAFQYASAKEVNAYNGVEYQRTMVMVSDESLIKPIILDVLKIDSDSKHQYDLPFYYKGHLVDSNIDYDAFTTEQKTLGKSNGYEHLWVEAKGKGKDISQITWLSKERFYSITTNSDSETDVYYTRIGAGDPHFNLRNDPGYMLRKNAGNHVFVSVIEPHGIFNPTSEFTGGSKSRISSIKVLYNDNEYTAAHIVGNELDWILIISNNNNEANAKHSLTIADRSYEWLGPITLIK
ncbi:MAG: heparinase II/III family protein [Bacteroidetes bacterium]|nr:heparinase II/III family protein [Bacteroidota bacterium]